MIIGLHQTKHADNLANVVRSCSAFGISEVQVTGPRIVKALKESNHRVFRHKQYEKVLIRLVDEFEIPSLYTPVAIEIVSGAQLLPYYTHPNKAFYIFGPEDGSIPSKILRYCHGVVQIPTSHCLNLSHAVTTVLYDKEMKRVI